MPLSVSTARIVAFGMPAPDGSLTAPVMSPEEPTPCACTTPVANTRQSKSHPPLIGFISPPSEIANFRGIDASVCIDDVDLTISLQDKSIRLPAREGHQALR